MSAGQSVLQCLDWDEYDHQLPLVLEEIAALYLLAAERGAQIGLERDLETAYLDSVPQLVPIVVSNLIENAIKYAPDSGEVKVSIRETGSHFHLIVEDSGQGVPDSERKQILNHFYRLPNVDVQGSVLSDCSGTVTKGALRPLVVFRLI